MFFCDLLLCRHIETWTLFLLQHCLCICPPIQILVKDTNNLNLIILTKQDLQDLNKDPHLECHVQNFQVEMACINQQNI